MLNELAQEIHSINVKNGFYEEEKNVGQMIALMHSELSEGLEADRKGRWSKNLPDNYSPDIAAGIKYKGMGPAETMKHFGITIDDDRYIRESLDELLDTVEFEMADTIIRVLDFCTYFNIDIDKFVTAKMRYNEMRQYKHGKSY